MTVDQAKSWLRENQALVYFLIAQMLGIGAVVLSGTAYMVRLDARVEALEKQGSPHLAAINTRLTVLEGHDADNKRSIERIVDVMTKELHIQPQRSK